VNLFQRPSLSVRVRGWGDDEGDMEKRVGPFRLRCWLLAQGAGMNSGDEREE